MKKVLAVLMMVLFVISGCASMTAAGEKVPLSNATISAPDITQQTAAKVKEVELLQLRMENARLTVRLINAQYQGWANELAAVQKELAELKAKVGEEEGVKK